MKTGIVTLGLLLLPLAASAALPPQYQRQRELTQIIESPEVEDALDGRPIDSVATKGDDVYVVTAGTCSVVVEIVDSKTLRPSGWAGPRQFGLSVGEANCVDGNEG
ncbi:hypothetical protein [Henriciella litoralis]|uniref:hypothetical protein n=1 Tax=Henriciella litoralis TaxID=568102 RepID=UPI000A048C83|nr:hypothetical protein [Henriciella litoralis]